MICTVFFFYCALDLVREQTTFGRKADCNISDLIAKTRLQEISNIHFSIIKDDVNDPLCPIFLEVRTSENDLIVFI